MSTKKFRLGLIPCGGKKRKELADLRADQLYIGSIFQVIFRHALQNCDEVLIMSARFGLVRVDQRLPYYEAFVKTISIEERRNLIELLQSQDPGLWPRPVCSYLPEAYWQIVEQAIPSARFFQRPYKGLRLTTLFAHLTR